MRPTGWVIAALILTSFAPATAADMPVKSVVKAPAPSDGGFWIGAEYLLWSAKGDKLPALVTTSPPGTPLAQAGVLGMPGTSVLFGDGVNDRWRSGARVSAGYWFDPQRRAGVEAQFFALNKSSTNFSANSGSFPVLGQPFFDATTGLQSSSLIAFPGLLSGAVAIQDSSGLLGAGAAYRAELCQNCAFGKMSGLIGYRFLRLQDRLGINAISAAAAGGVVPVGTTFSVTDRFDTASDFHGLDLGLIGEVANGPWTLTWRASVAVGGTLAKVDINGGTVVSVPGAVTTIGGTYALPTNIGSHATSRFAASPELAANVDYHVNNRLRAFAGYSLLYWAGLVRPGGAIDTAINPTQLGGFPLAGPARPQAQFRTTDYWAQGFNAGLTYSF